MQEEQEVNVSGNLTRDLFDDQFSSDQLRNSSSDERDVFMTLSGDRSGDLSLIMTFQVTK